MSLTKRMRRKRTRWRLSGYPPPGLTWEEVTLSRSKPITLFAKLLRGKTATKIGLNKKQEETK